VTPFVDEHRERFGVEPICKALQVAPSAYWREAARKREPALCPPRRRRDAALLPEIERVWNGNMRVYGADKVWKQLRREGTTVARCTVERLMRRQGLRGVIRGKSVRTTVPDAKAPCPLDRVNRAFRAERPNVSGKPAAFFLAGLSIRTMPSSKRNEEHWAWKQAAASPADKAASSGV